MKARKFAREEIRPISLDRDRISEPGGTWDWEIMKKGSRLGFRTAIVPKEWGGHGADFVTQAVVMAELAKADSAISKAFSQNWKWGHLIAGACSQEQKERFLKPFMADDTYVLSFGGTEPNAGSDNRYPPEDDPRAGLKLRAERKGDEWLLNGEKTFIANGGVLLMNFSSDVIQRVTALNMAVHGAAGGVMNAHADKLVRDGIIWTHLAGDASQRLKGHPAACQVSAGFPAGTLRFKAVIGQD